jgi:hypothetical protein
MSSVFISHASDDFTLAGPFVDNIVRLGCGVPAESIFYSSGADTGVPSGADLNAVVRKKVGTAKLAVCLLTPAFRVRPYCLAELGAAWSRTNNLFPLRHPDLELDDLDGVLKGIIVHPFNDEAALDELHERICAAAKTSVAAKTWSSYKKKWLEALPSLLESSPSPSESNGASGPNRSPTGSVFPDGGSKRWGQIFDSWVDAALYTKDNAVARTEIRNAVEKRTLVPSRYLYAHDSGAEGWLQLCGDPMYRHYRETTEFWAGQEGAELASLIRAELGRDDFDYVSLGSGDGVKDGELVSCWLESGADIFYYPYDISFPLACRAHQTVWEKMGSMSDTVRIKAVLADFSYLSYVGDILRHRASPNVVSLLGNSLGNLTGERSFLRKLVRLMSCDDILVLEVRLQTDGGELQEVETMQAMRFDFGPLENYLGMTFDADRMTARHVTHVSSIPDTRTILVACENETHGEIKLSYIHEYTEESFVKAVVDAGFEKIETRLGGEEDGFLVCVARPKQKVRARNDANDGQRNARRTKTAAA